jgi:outer membrane cobalamin receptor
MQIKQLLLVVLLVFYQIQQSAAQQTAPGFSGTVTSAEGIPIPGATVKVGDYARVTDQEGVFSFDKLTPKTYPLTIVSIGFKTISTTIDMAANLPLKRQFRMDSDTRQLKSVEVMGRTKVLEVNRQPFNVTALDATKLHNSTLDIAGALDRVSGVRVRETGGLGSNFNLSLNGFSGNHIRFFLDGVPMDNFGSSFQINNIPINIAERVEIYKGVVPMWLGADALGGAVNIVTGDRFRNYVDVAYTVGSFNTHRSVINAAVTSKSGLTLQLNAFQNYSDNDYKVTVDAADINTGAYSPGTRVNRFHDKYHNETLIANVGVVNKPYADKLLLGITLGQNYKEIQTGARMVSVFGQWHRRGNMIMPTFKYQKKDLIKGLDVNLNANYNFGKEQNIDTAYRRYDWFGNYKQYPGNGAERSRTMYKYGNNTGLATTMLNYRLTDQHSFALSNVFSTFNRKGEDELNLANNAFERTQKTHKNILGLGYMFTTADKWDLNIFGKYIVQNSIVGQQSINQETTQQQLGYGVALSYTINRNLQLKTSYEKANRMPEATEIFGDVENFEGNSGLKPEVSDNLNLGLMYSFSLQDVNKFSISANAIYRNASNFIYYQFNQNQSKLVADNREGVTNIGGDIETRYSYKDWLSAGLNLTYQNIINQQEYEGNPPVLSPVYKDRMPNIPFLYGNGDVTLSFKNVGRTGNNMSVGYNLLYVHAFYLYWPSRGASGDKYGIPKQLSHDANLMYSMKNGRYNISLECKNLNDALLYDNFSLQKPSRSFFLKLRYFINKTS